MKRFPILPAHPERICWGCDRWCPADRMQCGNGSERSPHPVELFGPDWAEWEDGRPPEPAAGSADEGTTGAFGAGVDRAVGNGAGSMVIGR